MAWSRDPGQLVSQAPTVGQGRDTQLGRHALDTERQGTEHRRAGRAGTTHSRTTHTQSSRGGEGCSGAAEGGTHGSEQC